MTPENARKTTLASRDKHDAPRAVGEPHVEVVADGRERLRVDVYATGDGRYRFVALARYDACDAAVEDRFESTETFDSEAQAREAGIVKARQLAGIDVPEA